MLCRLISAVQEDMDRDAVRCETRRIMLKALATDIPEDVATPLTKVENEKRNVFLV